MPDSAVNRQGCALLPNVAENRSLVRGVDESGESYLVPLRFFLALALPLAAIRALSKKSA